MAEKEEEHDEEIGEVRWIAANREKRRVTMATHLLMWSAMAGRMPYRTSKTSSVPRG
jgi:hypothetical protein